MGSSGLPLYDEALISSSMPRLSIFWSSACLSIWM